LDLSPGCEKIDSHFTHQEIYWELGERDKEGDGVSKKQENMKVAGCLCSEIRMIRFETSL
jgi:hypothetical protein